MPSLFVIALACLVACAQAGVIHDDSYSSNDHQGSDIESHDFSASETAHFDSLGSLGDHLADSHFPSDFSDSHGLNDHEYEEAASEHIESYGDHNLLQHDSSFYSSLHNDIHGDILDFHSKPVPGINHGKGALSYSTTYEFKDPKP